MPNPTFVVEIIETASLALVSESEQTQWAELVEYTASLWGRYIDSDATITIGLSFESQGEQTLATAGPAAVFRTSIQDGISIFDANTGLELQDGQDRVDGPDITLTVNADLLGSFYLGDQSEDAVVPGGLFDLQTIIGHEIGHGLGIIGFALDENGMLGADQTVFQTLLEFQGDTLFFAGPEAQAVFGGAIEIGMDDADHLADSGFIMSATLPPGRREFVSDVEVAILKDLGIPIVEATSGDDRLYGFSASDDTLSGLAGNDALFALSGDDMLMGNAGIDRLVGGLGNDSIFGGTQGDTVSGGEGSDLLVGEAGSDIAFASSGDDLLIGGYAYLNGAVGVDETGAPGTAGDTLFGGAGRDVLLADSWRDDNLNGQFDVGEASFADGSGNILYAGTGDDQVYGASGRDTVGGGIGDDTLVAGGGDDTVYGGQDQGDTGANDVVDGGDGNDLIFAGAGNDNVGGGSGSDTIFGGGGDDTITGGAGADSVFGGGGDDNLAGGAGVDTFFFAGNHGEDVMTDFSVDDDILVLANTVTDFADALSVQAAATDTTVSGESGVLIDTGGGTLFIEGLTRAEITDDILLLTV